MAAEESSTSPTLSDSDVVKIFQEFDTSGDGFIELAELQAALAKAGKPVSKAEAEVILKKVDSNEDGQISLSEFKAVFLDETSKDDQNLSQLVGVQDFFLQSFGRVGEVLGIEVAGQWRTTASGCRYVDDVIGSGSLVVDGDTVQVQFTVTDLSTGSVLETSRGAQPLAFTMNDASDQAVSAPEQGWSDAVANMRIGGQRRVYVNLPKDGPPGSEDAGSKEGSETQMVRYDIEIVGLLEWADVEARQKMISSLNGRRDAVRLLFAATFIPYFLPDRYQPAMFKSGWGEQDQEGAATETNSEAVLFGDKQGTESIAEQAENSYVSKQMDALFSAK